MRLSFSTDKTMGAAPLSAVHNGGQCAQMLDPVEKGRYRLRLADGAADLDAALRLRALAFRGDADRDDRDRLDADCLHLLIEETGTGALVACFRVLPLASGAEVQRSYSAQFYDLSRLGTFPGRICELGRFCLRPGLHDPDIVRLSWAGLMRLVENAGADMMIGCSSFHGTDPRPVAPALALLGARQAAPVRWAPQPRMPEHIRLADFVPPDDPARGLAAMPPLLRSYLGMGCWTSDHAVIDRDLGTLHVFTGLERAAIPPARLRRLLELAS